MLPLRKENRGVGCLRASKQQFSSVFNLVISKMIGAAFDKYK